MSSINDATSVGVVGSPSTNWEISLDILGSASHEPIVGGMLFLTHPLGAGEELALGTVTEVETTNTFHQNPLLRGVVKAKGTLTGMSGDQGDIRAATIKIQACYKHEGDKPWAQSGPSMRTSPPTGAFLKQINDEVISDLMAGEKDLHYLGRLHSTDVKIPMSMRDFSGERGAVHQAVFGQSGSGKTVFANYILAGQMRHRDMGMIIVDPQGQFSSETGFSFSLQEWANEMGREVIVRRVSEDLQLGKDAPLFVSLLTKTKFTREIQKMAAETAEILMEEFAKVLKSYEGEWETEDSSTLLRSVMDSLRDPKKLKKVYADPSRQRRLLESLSDILGDIPEVDEGGNQVDPSDWPLCTVKETERLFRELLSQFAPLHNLFSDKNPNGAVRHPMWGTIQHVFDKSSRQGAPAPLLILDMSTSGNVSWLKSLIADEDAAEAMEAIRVLDQDSIKASILSQVCRTLKNASESAFREGETLNTMVVFDEAWRYAPPPHQASVVEIAELSKELAGYARDTRKFGIGWFYITQSPRSLNDDIWGQLAVAIMGYGLAGPDLAKVGELMDDPDHLKLYRGFAPPDSTNPKIYPFMMVGPVSPLSFTKAPVFLSAYTDFDQFRLDNYQWIEQIRSAQGLPVKEGTPTLAGGHILVPVSTRRKVGKGETDRAAGQIRAFGSTGGVNPADSAHLSKDDGFASASTALDTPAWASAATRAAMVTHVPVPAADPVQDVPGGLRLVTAQDAADDDVVDDTVEDNSALLDGFLPVSPPDQEPF